MDHSNDTLASNTRASGSAFRRVGATVAVACAITGSVIGLGSLGALASPTSTSVVASASTAATTTQEADPKVKVNYTADDLAAFAASPYSGDALNLAAIWETTPEWAQGKAGSKIRAGIALPFAAGEATTIAYTPDQERLAFQFTVEDYTQLIGLASVWGSDDLIEAKAELGGLLLAHQPLPTIPATFTDEQQARAFELGGLDDADAAKIAGLWQTDTHSAVVRAGAKVLAGESLPL